METKRERERKREGRERQRKREKEKERGYCAETSQAQMVLKFLALPRKHIYDGIKKQLPSEGQRWNLLEKLRPQR